MGLDDDIAILAGAPVFCFLDRDALRLLSFAGDRRELAEGEALFRRGDKTDGGFVVIAGAVELAPVGKGEAVVAGPSALIGRNALFKNGRRPTDALAMVPSEVMRIAPTLMARVLREFPAAADAIYDSVSEDLLDLTRGLRSVGAKLATSRPKTP